MLLGTVKGIPSVAWHQAGTKGCVVVRCRTWGAWGRVRVVLCGEQPGAVCNAAVLPHGADKTPWQMEKPLDHQSFPQVHVVPITLL